MKNTKLIISLFLVLLGLQSGNADDNPPFSPSCDLMLEVPTDLHLCEPGEFNLCGVIMTTYADVEFEWLEDGSSTSHDLCDDVFVSEATTFTLVATATSDDNIIVNGDFANGDDGSFTTDYTPGQGNCFHSAGFLGCEGFYNILDDPGDGHTNFGSCNDFSGDGNMMVVNGASSLQEIWCQVVCVDPDASYLFSSWATSVNPSSPARLQFSIDGNLIGSRFDLSGTNCDWEQFEADWQANGETSVEICVTNQNTAAGGNDFALDEIEFFQVCEEVEEFEVTVSDLEIDENNPDLITCENEESVIDIFIQTSFDFTDIEWDTDDGNITGVFNGDLSVSVDEPGTYSVTVTDEFGCTFEEEIFVDENTVIPSLELIPDGILDCQNNEVEIEANSDGDDPEYVWENELGVFLGDDDEIFVTTPGIYFVTVTDEDNGCTNVEQIEIEQMINQPNFDLLSSNNLNCNSPTSILNTSVEYDDVTWTNAAGTPITVTNDTLTVTTPGTYFATVDIAGCTQTNQIIVSEIIPNFEYTEALETTIINCDNEGADFSLTFDPALFSLTWLGAASSLGSQPNVEFSSAGTFLFELTDSLGCTTIDSISLSESFDPPEVFASATDLSCTATSADVTINWLPNIVLVDEVFWTLPDGSSFFGSTVTDVSQAGTVVYTAFSALNGCSTTDSIEVIATGDFPEVAVQTTKITCNQPIARLDAASPNDDLTYEWTLPDGSLLFDQTIETDQGGLHFLIATALNGCATRSEHLIEEDLAGPNLEDLADINLNCNKPDTLISVASQAGVTFNWTLESTGESVQGPELLLTEQNTGRVILTATGVNGCITQDTFAIDQDFALPEAVITGGVLTCDEPSYQAVWDDLNGTVASAIWTLPSGQIIEDLSIEISEPGTYQIQFITAVGCTQLQEITVTEEKDLPDFEIAATGLNCDITSSTINVTSTESFQQIEYFRETQSIGFGQELIVDSNDSITVVVTAENGCMTSEIVAPSLDTLSPSFSVTAPDLGCQILGGVLIDTITTALLSNLQIRDENGLLIGDLTESITMAGTYTVTATGENGCTGSAAVIIGNDDSTVDFAVDPLTLTCREPMQVVPIITLETYSSATLLNTNGDIVSHADFPDELTVSEEGTFTVIVTNTNGCTSEQPLEIDLDVAEVDFDIETTLIDCNNTFSDISLLTAQNFESAIILDQTDTPLATIDGTTKGAQLSTGGTYTMQVTGLNGCIAFRDFVVDIDTSTLDFDLEAGLLQCNDEPAEINLQNATGAFTEAWYRPLGSIMPVIPITGDFEVTTTGIYEVTLRSENGCTNTNIIEVFQNQDVPEFSTFIVETTSCEGSGILTDLSITGGEAPYQIFIDNVETDFLPAISISGLGDHSIQIIDANGCELNSNFVLDPLPIPQASHEPEFTILEGAELQLNLQVNRALADLTIEWLPQTGLSCYDCANPFFVGKEDTEYTVTVIDQYGCQAQAEVLILVEQIVKVYIPNVLDLTNGQGADRAFTLYSGEGDIEIIEALFIYDRWGNLIFEGFDLQPNDPSVGWDGRRAGRDVEQGVYVYQSRIRYSNQETEDFAGDVTLLK